MPKLLRLQEGWLTIGLLALLLFSVTLSIQQAQWSDGLSILTPITLVALATGIILAKVSGVPRLLLDIVGLHIGLITILIAVASVITNPDLVTIQQKVHDILYRTGLWIGVALRREPSDDLLVFILSLALVAWVLAYSSAYFVFKSRQLWWALVPNAVALLINLSYSAINLNSYILIFIFAALLLMVRFNLILQEERWQRERVNYSPSLTWPFLWAGTAVSLVLALAMWFVPTTSPNSTLNTLWNRVNQPWVELQNTFSSLWAGVQGGNATIGGYSSFNDNFTMGGALNLSNQVALLVTSQDRQRLYWRAMTYDQYNGIGWKNTAPQTLTVLPDASSRLSLDPGQPLPVEDLARTPLTYTVQLISPKDDTIYAPSRPLELGLTSRLNISWRKLDAVYNVGTTAPLSVPLELRPLLGILEQSLQELNNPQPGTLDSGPGTDPIDLLLQTSLGPQITQQQDLLDRRGLKVTFDIIATPPQPTQPSEPGTLDPGSGTRDYVLDLRVSGEIPIYEDITSLHSPERLPAGHTYTATSLKSLATDQQLRETGALYPPWVVDRYLDLPATVPQRVRDIAEEIVTNAGATTPFDRAKALETYLRDNFTYNTAIPLPPAGSDRVDWFLFQNKEGYCEYYASAMIVMLRSLGIPSRMASGYAPGELDPATGVFTVRESAAHTWPEVYFPTYGWIEFEPTPSQPSSAQGPATESEFDSPTFAPSAIPEAPDLNISEHENLDAQHQTGGFLNMGETGNWYAFAIAAVALIALVALFTFVVPVLPWAPRATRVGNAGDYYGRMLRWARFLGFGPTTHQTPYEFADQVAREVPGTSLFSRSITRAYVRERFSRDGLPTGERIPVVRAWESLRGRLLRAVPARQFKRASRRRR
jgi:transglutaminase-like putative cysteine protease